jgi:hypothetical protein
MPVNESQCFACSFFYGTGFGLLPSDKKMIMRGSMVLLGCCFGIAALAQTVSISVNGDRNQQVIVNGMTYHIDNNAVNNTSKNITLTNLRPGEYSLQLIRINDNNINDDKVPVPDNTVSRIKTTTTFTVRTGYDVAIVIAPNGIIQVKDKLIAGTTSDPGIAMADAAFTSLLNDIQYQWRNTRKITSAQTAFSNNNNYFTARQARQIIQTVIGEENRLALAKIAYSRIIDPGNFIQVYDLMSTQAGKDELASFIRQSGADMVFSYSESFRTSMSEASFEALLQKFKLNMNPDLRLNAVTEVLTNETNYFTVAQVRRMTELVDFESSRLRLLKDAYTHVTDPALFPQLYNLLTTDATRAELIDFVNNATRNGGLVNYNLSKSPLSNADFVKLYNAARVQMRDNTQIIFLTNTFADITNYFTAKQAARLISLVGGELNRLSLAKSAYRLITDPEHYLPLMGQLLASPLSRNELNSYAYSYRAAQ